MDKMARHTRIQGLVIQDYKILLIRGYERYSGISFWVIPGGGPEPDETDKECAIREIREETGLDIQVGRLLIEQKALSGSMYKKLKSNPRDSGLQSSILHYFIPSYSAKYNDKLLLGNSIYEKNRRVLWIQPREKPGLYRSCHRSW